MKSPLIPSAIGRFGALFILAITTGLFGTSSVQAGLTFNLHVYEYGGVSYGQTNYTYYFDPQLVTNANPPVVPFGNFYLTSYGIPTNGSSSSWQYDANGLNQTDGDRNSYGDFNSMVHELTNGFWSLYVTNAISTNVYHFGVKVNITSNDLPKVTVSRPAAGAVDVTNQPTFAWSGPTNYSSLSVIDYTTYDQLFYVSLFPTQTTYVSPIPLLQGLNTFNPDFLSNSVTALSITSPTNSSGKIYTNLTFACTLDDSFSSPFSVGLPDTSGTYRSLVAHFPFDLSSGPVLGAGTDTSGNSNSLDFTATFGSAAGLYLTNDSIAGAGAMVFQDGDGNSGGVLGWNNPTPPVLLSNLQGSFSVSCWVKTTQYYAYNTAPAFQGAGVVSADVSGVANDTVPIALTGGAVAFNTGGNEDDTLNSQATVNDGNYHHIVVTRNQQTGQKIIYIDGAFDSFASGTTNLLTDPQKLTIGALANAGNPDPNDGSYSQGYDGELDDLQFYSGVLSADDVAYLYANPGQTLPAGSTPSGGHSIIAQYTFDNSNNLGEDFSTNQNNIYCGSYWGPTGHVFTTDAIAGGGAVQFFGQSSITPCNQTFTNWETTLLDSFTFSAWIKTTNTVGNNSDALGDGSGQTVIYLNSNLPNYRGGVIPLGITGSKAAFFTGSQSGGDTLHSTNSVTSGTYTHIVVTRDEVSGRKAIYINGVLDSADYGEPGPLNADTTYASIGGQYSSAYVGKVDDVQLYSGVLNAAEVAYLYAHPGLTVSNVAGSGDGYFNVALGTTNLLWNTGGDTSWQVESTNTYNNQPEALQSGSVTNNQQSEVSVSVTGPGTLTYDWSTIANDPLGGFTLQFAVDGNVSNSIYGDTSWYQDGPYLIPAGPHVLSWTAYAYGDTDATEEAFLDQVSFVPIASNVPIITLNPFSQTNYPGYQVALLAAAVTNPAVTWQWFEAGNPTPIPNATSALFIPTNSGTAGVAGSYYAVASNVNGSTLTTTAAVTFASAPLPPAWTRAFKSPFTAVNDGATNQDYFYGCTTDTNGNVYVAAEFGGNTTVGASNLDSGTGGDAAAILKLTPTGSPLWAVGITNNGAGSSFAESVALAPGGGVYISGDFSSTNWLGTNRLTDNGGGDFYVARFDANGSNLWVKTFGGTNTDFTLINTLASDSAGDVTMSGLLGSGPVTVGSNNYNVTGQRGIIIQLDQNGAVRWSELSSFAQYIISSPGRLYVSLSSDVGATTNIVIGSSTNITDRTYGIACLNATNGQPIWVKGVGAQSGSFQGNPYYASLADDVPRLALSGTNLYLTGAAYSSNALFGAISVNFGDLRGQYFARYDTNGNAQTATTYGSVTTTPLAAVANSAGYVYVSGYFDTYSLFGQDILAAPIATRPFNGQFSQGWVAKFDANGNSIWADEAVSSGLVNFLGIALANNGVWASGWTVSGYYPAVEPAIFGTNYVFSDAQIVTGGAGGSENIIWHPAGVLGEIMDAVALPVDLIKSSETTTNFQFSFASESGFTHYVQYTTNLLAGPWQTYTNFPGDGTVKTNSIPLSLFSPSKQGFIRVYTH